MRLKESVAGFTIVELLVATMIFSIVLLLCATAIVQVGQMYYKGIVTNRTEDTSRRAIDDVTRTIQFGASGVAAGFLRTSADDSGIVAGTQAICLGTARYSYAANNLRLEGSNYNAADGTVAHVLWKDYISASDMTCKPRNLSLADPSLGAGGAELVDERMRVSAFDVATADPTDPNTQLWNVQLTIAYGEGNGAAGDYGVFRDNTYTSCATNKGGGAFCAISSLNTYVRKRL